jgi:hypothetical protein
MSFLMSEKRKENLEKFLNRWKRCRGLVDVVQTIKNGADTFVRKMFVLMTLL